MPNGKPAGVPCIQLLVDFKCALFGKPERPAFCDNLQPSLEMCGDEFLENPRDYAITWLTQLEVATKPA